MSSFQHIRQQICHLIQWSETQHKKQKKWTRLRFHWLLGQWLQQCSLVKKHDLIALISDLRQESGVVLSIEQCRIAIQLYQAFSEPEQLFPQLTLSHYKLLLKQKNSNARNYYLNEALHNHWSSLQLYRHIKSKEYERLYEKTPDTEHSRVFLKKHYVLEFLNLKNLQKLPEKQLEQAILAQLQPFIAELGRGFAFIGSQKRIVTASGKNFFIDLVFYHYLLKCFVLIDLKSGELSHADIGQMDMYVRLYDDLWRGISDNPSIGIILCTDKDNTLVHYSILRESSQLFAATYELQALPEERQEKAEPFFAHFHPTGGMVKTNF
ncbi:MAG TPA: PDDEXK nuclease domain-containing protein [Saprospiraceae bacterium]|nr:PDDEXK nuclease domain-containing protein [Saprospiraceae bacterium]HMQ85745.1 PDDEXK nuclease domain-containing protein [Saprospiraceae bacterium]